MEVLLTLGGSQEGVPGLRDPFGRVLRIRRTIEADAEGNRCKWWNGMTDQEDLPGT